jgi:hypothetical protein
LLGYILVSKFKSFEDNSVAGYHLFHCCMRKLLDPLVASGKDGVEMHCANGFIWCVHPILAAYIGDPQSSALLHAALRTGVPSALFLQCKEMTTHGFCMAIKHKQQPPVMLGLGRDKHSLKGELGVQDFKEATE